MSVVTSTPEAPDHLSRYGVMAQTTVGRPWQHWGVVDLATGTVLLDPKNSQGRSHAVRIATAANTLNEMAEVLNFKIDITSIY